MKKKISVLLMVLVMVLSATVTSYAAVGDEVMPRATASTIFTINRISGTTANAVVTTDFSGIANEYSVVLYLQKLTNGSWINDSTNPDYALFNNGINKATVVVSNTYDSLQYGATYRLMVVSRDIINGVEYRTTTYSNSF